MLGATIAVLWPIARSTLPAMPSLRDEFPAKLGSWDSREVVTVQNLGISSFRTSPEVLSKKLLLLLATSPRPPRTENHNPANVLFKFMLLGQCCGTVGEAALL